MGLEIERKFLVEGDGYRALAQGMPYRQGYLRADVACTVRVRTMGDKAALTIKGPTAGLSRAEFEYPIPLEDAGRLLAMCCLPVVEKTRYEVPFGGLVWHVDEFHGANRGLVIAECELESEDQEVVAPGWVGAEVSGDPRYFNSSLARQPFAEWRDDEGRRPAPGPGPSS